MDEKSLLKPLEGQLNKYTNVMKGWQFRWFCLSPEEGILFYYLHEGDKSRPRGSVHLAGAEISPSDEDSHTFIVNSASGDVYKLRASDARERQHWVDKLRAVSQRHTQAIAHTNPAAPTTGSRLGYSSLTVLDAFSSVRQILQQAARNQIQLAHAIESLPPAESPMNCTDTESLLLKATSAATITCLEQCLQILQHQQYALAMSSAAQPEQHVILTSMNKRDPSRGLTLWECLDDRNAINIDDEVSDSEDSWVGECSSKELSVRMDENKVMILSLLSQWKLGMDLTRVTLPTFIFEPRSLLEMYADYLDHPRMFLRICEGGSAEDRMIALVEWYLTLFYIGRRGSTAHKPYNSLLGERFHCSWNVQGNSGRYTVRYVGEQVSHHPPVSAFHLECAEKKISLDSYIYTQSKFMGMKIGVHMNGEIRVRLEQFNETYIMTLPSVYVHSVMTMPWIELGGKVTLHCPQTGYNVNILFHTKPFYGGKLYRISGEIKSGLNVFVCKIQGEWNSNIEFCFANGETRTIDVSKVAMCHKRVRPLSKQSILESRRLWSKVSSALKQGDTVTAATYKKQLEERQREEIRYREEKEQPYSPKFFYSTEEGWVYRAPY